MNFTNQNQSLVKSELHYYFIRLTIYNLVCLCNITSNSVYFGCFSIFICQKKSPNKKKMCFFLTLFLFLFNLLLLLFFVQFVVHINLGRAVGANQYFMWLDSKVRVVFPLHLPSKSSFDLYACKPEPNLSTQITGLFSDSSIIIL